MHDGSEVGLVLAALENLAGRRDPLQAVDDVDIVRDEEPIPVITVVSSPRSELDVRDGLAGYDGLDQVVQGGERHHSALVVAHLEQVERVRIQNSAQDDGAIPAGVQGRAGNLDTRSSTCFSHWVLLFAVLTPLFGIVNCEVKV